MTVARVFALLTILLVAGVIVFAVKPTFFFDVGGPELASSLVGEVDAGKEGQCTPGDDEDTWECVITVAGFDKKKYELTTVDEECWEAEPKDSKGKEKPKARKAEKFSGCVDVLDFTRLGDRIF